jgi:hypothetical protein
VKGPRSANYDILLSFNFELEKNYSEMWDPFKACLGYSLGLDAIVFRYSVETANEPPVDPLQTKHCVTQKP